MTLIIEISNHDPYVEIRRFKLSTLADAPVVGDTILWLGGSYEVRYRLIDYQEGLVIIKASYTR